MSETELTLLRFHCHNLIHEDNTMMDAFNVTYLEALGYNSSIDFADPTNSQFSAQDYSDAAYAPAAMSSAVSSLANLGAYASFSSLSAAESAYYATAGQSSGDPTTAPTTTTVAAVSSGFGFATSTATTNTKASIVRPGNPFTIAASRPTGRPTARPFGRAFSA